MTSDTGSSGSDGPAMAAAAPARRPAQTPVFRPPAFPEGVRMLFGIGAQKAGTSWLHDYLLGTGAVHFSRNKEVHYFDVRAGLADHQVQVRIDMLRMRAENLALDDRQLRPKRVQQLRDIVDILEIYTGHKAGAKRHDPYLRFLFGHHAGQPVVGDITPSYSILSRTDFADMASVGEARFIFILRDPVARMWSQLRMIARLEDDADALAPDARLAACRKHADALVASGRLDRGEVARADYARTMTELDAAVPAERILYVFFEDLFRPETTRKICAFLGIPHRPPDAARRVNDGLKVPLPEDLRVALRAALAPQYDYVRDRFGTTVPGSWAP